MINCESVSLYYYGNEKICVRSCRDKYPLESKNALGFDKCTDKCMESPYLYQEGNKCLDKCSNNKYEYKYKCISQCPPLTKVIGYKCIFKIDSLPLSSELIVNSEATKEEILNYIDSSILDTLEIKYSIKGNGYYLEVYPSNSPFPENNNISSINIDNCIKTLKRQYSIPSEESLIIAKIDTINNSSIINDDNYKVYSKEGVLLNLD